MYGLPDEFDPRTFVGREFETLTFASNAIHIVFGSECSVTAMHRVQYRLEAGLGFLTDVVPVASSRLPALIGRSIEGAEVRRPGALVLHLGVGGILMFDDDDSCYESYSMRTPAGEFFV